MHEELSHTTINHACKQTQRRQRHKPRCGSGSLQQFSGGVIGHGYDSMAALDQTDEKDVIDMNEDASIGMKKTHRTLFIKEWR
jgi:hypothetical protein